jgi:hypothetical protein
MRLARRVNDSRDIRGKRANGHIDLGQCDAQPSHSIECAMAV